MELPSTESGCKFVAEIQPQNAQEPRDPTLAALMMAHESNLEGVIFLEKGMTQVALESLERAAKSAMAVLRRAPVSSQSSQAAGIDDRPDKPMTISIITVRGTLKEIGASHILHNIFFFDGVDFLLETWQVLVAVVLYNLAYLLHVRSLDDDRSLSSRNVHGMKRALQLYQLVDKMNQQAFVLETPVLSLAALNNMGHIHYLLEEYEKMHRVWSEMSQVLVDLPPSFSLVNTEIFRLNLQLKDRVDDEEHPQKKQRSA